MNIDDQIKCITDKCSRVFKSGEYCTIDTAIKYGLNDLKKPQNIFDKNIVNDESYIDKYVNNIIDNKKPYSVCNLKNGIAYTNCALITNSPWFTLNENNTGCRIPSDLKLDGGFILNNKDNTITKPEETDIRKYANIKGYCQEKWFDWFTIPDYHIGNIYIAKKLKDPNDNAKYILHDIDKCYKPCDIGTVPYNNSDYENIGKCIDRDKFANGMFKGTSYYTPLAFINLIGNTNDDLKEYYKSLLLNTSNIITKSDYKELKTNVIEFISNTNNICDNIVNEATKARGYNIYHFFRTVGDSFTHNNVLEPDDYLKKLINQNTSLFKIKHSYNICKKLYDALEKKNKNNDDAEYNNIVDNIKDIIILAYTDNKKREDTINNEFLKTKNDILFKILKKASNICFGGETDYSKNYILYTLNNSSDGNLMGNKYTPFKFDMDFNKPDKTLITKRDIKQSMENIKKEKHIKSSCTINNKTEYRGTLFDQSINDLNNKQCPQSKYEWPDPISYLTTFIYMFLIFFIIYIIFILSDIFGYYITYLLNVVSIYIKNLYYYILDKQPMRGKYEASIYNLKKSKRNLSNIVRRLGVIRDSLNNE